MDNRKDFLSEVKKLVLIHVGNPTSSAPLSTKRKVLIKFFLSILSWQMDSGTDIILKSFTIIPVQDNPLNKKIILEFTSSFLGRRVINSCIIKDYISILLKHSEDEKNEEISVTWISDNSFAIEFPAQSQQNRN